MPFNSTGDLLSFLFVTHDSLCALSHNRTCPRRCCCTQFLPFRVSSAPFPCREETTCRTRSGETINDCGTLSGHAGTLGKWHAEAFEALGIVEIEGPLVVRCDIEANPLDLFRVVFLTIAVVPQGSDSVV